MQKKAAYNLSVGKLITIIMVFLVIFVVILGFTTGLWKPAEQKVLSLFNFVKGLFDKGGIDDGVFKKEVDIPGVGKGMWIIDEKECKVDLYDYKGSYRPNFETGGLEYYELNYVMSLGDDYVHPQDKNYEFLNNVQFRHNEMEDRWEWKPVYFTSTVKYWIFVGVPMTIASDIVFAPVEQIKTDYLTELKDKSLEEGEKFFEIKINEGKITKKGDWRATYVEADEPSKLSEKVAERLEINKKMKEWLWKKCK